MIDDCVGRVLDALERSGRADDTIVIFTSDHGELLGDHGLLRKGPPPYRQLLQVPFIISGPGIVADAKIDELTSHIDLLPTLASMLTGKNVPVDGLDMSAMLQGRSSSIRDYLFAEYHPRRDEELYNQTIVSKDWRLTLYPNNSAWGELFDLRADPWEHRNLFAERPDSAPVEEMTSTLMKSMPPKPTIPNEVLGAY